MTYGTFTAACFETLDSLEANEAYINARGRSPLAWLRRRYPVRETVFDNGEVKVTKIPLVREGRGHEGFECYDWRQ
jgi:hypothetical protein